MVGIYLGYDKPRNLGRGATGGHLAAPIAKDFLKLALADKPAIPFKVPAGIKLVRVDAKSGMRAGPGEGGRTILEAFKPGTAPPDNYSVIGVADADGRVRCSGCTPDADRQYHASGNRRALLAERHEPLQPIALCGVRRYIPRHEYLQSQVAVLSRRQRDHARRSRTPR